MEYFRPRKGWGCRVFTMRSAFRLISAFLALAVLAAPVAGMCVSLVAPEDPCAMQETPEMASCGHGKMLMSACCSAESAPPSADAILSGSAGDIDPPALIRSGLDARPATCGQEAAVLASDGDPPPAVPRYRLFSALLL